jgi:threonyl-tRNA synthetase
MWLAPTQVCVVPIAERHNDYAKEVYDKLFAAGIRVKLDDRSESMGYKIREALQGNKIPYVLVMGDKEIEENKVAVRIRGIGEAGKLSLDDFIEKAQNKIQTKTQDLTF